MHHRDNLSGDGAGRAHGLQRSAGCKSQRFAALFFTRRSHGCRTRRFFGKGTAMEISINEIRFALSNVSLICRSATSGSMLGGLRGLISKGEREPWQGGDDSDDNEEKGRLPIEAALAILDGRAKYLLHMLDPKDSDMLAEIRSLCATMLGIVKPQLAGAEKDSLEDLAWRTAVSSFELVSEHSYAEQIEEDKREGQRRQIGVSFMIDGDSIPPGLEKLIDRFTEREDEE